LGEELSNLNLATISPGTVRNRLNEQDIHGEVAKKKPMLTAEHQANRLRFARRHEHWSIEDWKLVLFSDETKINQRGSDGIIWTWKQKGSLVKRNHVRPTVKHEHSIMVWGCFSYAGLGNVYHIQDILTAARYVRILSGQMRPSADRLIGPNYIFQQDNDPKHTAKVTKKYFETKNIQVLEWPSMSPDLNPIENLWHELKKLIHEEKITSKHDILAVLKRCWEMIPKDYLENLVQSMPRRIDMVIANKRLWTDY
jgi:DDE superfamily endonuclease/Transposase